MVLVRPPLSGCPREVHFETGEVGGGSALGKGPSGIKGGDPVKGGRARDFLYQGEGDRGGEGRVPIRSRRSGISTRRKREKFSEGDS